MILVRSCPASPTKGSPCRSSSRPGPSPTKTNLACGFPDPKTICVRVECNLHLRQSPSSSRTASKVIGGADPTRGWEEALYRGDEERLGHPSRPQRFSSSRWWRRPTTRSRNSARRGTWPKFEGWDLGFMISSSERCGRGGGRRGLPCSSGGVPQSSPRERSILRYWCLPENPLRAEKRR